jgi:hypothetical protein
MGRSTQRLHEVVALRRSRQQAQELPTKRPRFPAPVTGISRLLCSQGTQATNAPKNRRCHVTQRREWMIAVECTNIEVETDRDVLENGVLSRTLPPGRRLRIDEGVSCVETKPSPSVRSSLYRKLPTRLAPRLPRLLAIRPAVGARLSRTEDGEPQANVDGERTGTRSKCRSRERGNCGNGVAAAG